MAIRQARWAANIDSNRLFLFTDRSKAMREFLFLALTICLILGPDMTSGAEERLALIDRIVALVEDDAIMKSELENRLHMVRRQLMRREGALPPLDLVRRQVLERLIIEHLQLQLAKRRGIRIDDLTLNETMQNIARSRGLSLEEFRDNLVDEGIDYVQFREQVRTELTVDAVRKRIVDRKVQVTDQEINDMIASQSRAIDRDVEYRINHILVTIPEAANAGMIQDARLKAESLQQRARKGEDFRSLAMSESDGQHALEGGDLGWRELNQLPTIFAARIPTMKIGAVSEVIRSPSGFHVIFLADRRGGERKVINQTHARHILIKTSALMDDDQARSKLRK